jgi:hypothetical protein
MEHLINTPLQRGGRPTNDDQTNRFNGLLSACGSWRGAKPLKRLRDFRVRFATWLKPGVNGISQNFVRRSNQANQQAARLPACHPLT